MTVLSEEQLHGSALCGTEAACFSSTARGNWLMSISLLLHRLSMKKCYLCNSEVELLCSPSGSVWLCCPAVPFVGEGPSYPVVTGSRHSGTFWAGQSSSSSGASSRFVGPPSLQIRDLVISVQNHQVVSCSQVEVTDRSLARGQFPECPTVLWRLISEHLTGLWV